MAHLQYMYFIIMKKKKTTKNNTGEPLKILKPEEKQPVQYFSKISRMDTALKVRIRNKA